jgi:hypothetical protein
MGDHSQGSQNQNIGLYRQSSHPLFLDGNPNPNPNEPFEI